MISVDLKALKTFEAIARLGSFQKAAEELKFAQSTVTLQIQRFEADLGVSLFIREGKRTNLTEAGRWLSGQASILLSSVKSLRSTVMEIDVGEAGQIHIAGIEPAISTVIAPVISDFCKKRPNIGISVEVGGTHSISEGVSSGELDFGICSAPPAHFRLAFEPLFEEKLGLLVPVNHKLASMDNIKIEDLVGETIILKERTCAYRELTEKSLVQRGITPFSKIEIGSFGLIQRFVLAGHGVGIYPIYQSRTLPISLVVKPFSNVQLTMAVGLTRNTKRVLGKAAQSLLDEIRDGCQSDRITKFS